MNVVVFGAGGGIGKTVVERSLARGWSVTAFLRRPDALADIVTPRLKVFEGDVRDAEAVHAATSGADAVAYAIGSLDRKSKVRSEGMTNVVNAMEHAGARRIVAVSAIGVGDSREQARISSFVFGRIVLPLFLSKPFADMDQMENILRRSTLSWTIVRPTGLTNEAAAQRVFATTDGWKVGTRIPRPSVATWMVDAIATSSHVHGAPSLWAA